MPPIDDKFKDAVKLIAEAEDDRPVTLAAAARQVKMPVATLRVLWASFCKSYDPRSLPGEWVERQLAEYPK